MGIGSEYFVVYLSCVYIYVRLIMSSYLLFCISFAMFGISNAVQMKRSSVCKVIVEVLVLGLLVTFFKKWEKGDVGSGHLGIPTAVNEAVTIRNLNKN